MTYRVEDYRIPPFEAGVYRLLVRIPINQHTMKKPRPS